MSAKRLYAVYVWLTAESSRGYTPDKYGGVRAQSVDQAMQCFMHSHCLSSVERAMIMHVSEQGEMLGGVSRYRVFCPGCNQGAQP